MRILRIFLTLLCILILLSPMGGANAQITSYGTGRFQSYGLGTFESLGKEGNLFRFEVKELSSYEVFFILPNYEGTFEEIGKKNEDYLFRSEGIGSEDGTKGGWFVVPIQGWNLQPGIIHRFGPYSCYNYFCCNISWSPENTPIGIGYQYSDESCGSYRKLYGGQGSMGFEVNPDRSFYVVILNPPENTQAIDSYGGTIYLRVY